MQIFRTNKVDVYRFERTGNSDKYGSTPVYEGLDCQITPAGEEITAIYGGNLAYQLHEIYFTEEVTLQNGDKLKGGGREFIVREAPERYETPFLSHTRVIVEEVVS